MKYTFKNKNGKTQTVMIDDAWVRQQKVNLGITNQEAIDMWLFDNGYVDNDVVDELTAQAKENGANMSVRGGGKPRKKPERKPDYVKRSIISNLETAMTEDEQFKDLGVVDVKVTNIERIIAFNVGDDEFTITLTKKRKPKN